MQIEIAKNLEKEINDYCKINKIDNVNDFINKIIKSGFTIEKFGNHPPEEIINKKRKSKPIEVESEEPVKETKIKQKLQVIEKTKKIESKRDIYGE